MINLGNIDKSKASTVCQLNFIKTHLQFIKIVIIIILDFREQITIIAS